MVLTPFAKQLVGEGVFAFDVWRYDEQIETGLGAPDERMVEMATALIEFVQMNSQLVGDHVFASYRRKTEQDPDWFRSLWRRISRDTAAEPPSSAVVHLTPRWDQEHAFRLTVREGRPVELNDSETALQRLRG